MTAHRFVLPLFLVLAPPALLVAAQDPPPDPEPEPLPPIGAPGERGAAIAERLEGAWSLQEIAGVREPIGPDEVNGFMLVVDGYVSMIVHAREVQRGLLGAANEELRLQGTIRQFEVRDTETMLTSAVIGHSTFSGDLELERLNEPESYIVELLGNDLFITRADGSKLVFRRMRSGSFPPVAEEELRERKAAEKWDR